MTGWLASEVAPVSGRPREPAPWSAGARQASQAEGVWRTVDRNGPARLNETWLFSSVSGEDVVGGGRKMSLGRWALS